VKKLGLPVGQEYLQSFTNAVIYPYPPSQLEVIFSKLQGKMGGFRNLQSEFRNLLGEE
jgi:hypothetical protein